jgi:hypothetical protein
LAIPLVQSELPENFAGATIANGNARGILVNVAGRNENVWVRRTTIAHELGHLLWDPDQRLNSLRVDDYIDIERDALFGGTDYVEQRANAFAVEFLAPQAAVEAEFRKYGDASSGVAGVMQHFGVSFTVARFQIWNALGRKIDFDELHTSQLKPSDEWNGKESFTVDFFPIDSTPISRRGAFAGIVVAAEGKGLISADTAQSYLVCSAAEYKSEASFIAELFPFWSVKG